MATIENILFIIVSYKEYYYDSETFKSLIKSFDYYRGKSQILNVFIGDNTDIKNWEINKVTFENINIIYNKFENIGISKVYNKGVDLAIRNNLEWVVLLDQDTSLPTNFCEVYAQSILEDNKVFIKVPKVYLKDKHRLLSPAKYIGYRSFLIKKIESGVQELKNISFINTGILVNISLFKKVRGYNEKIKLDFSDHDFVYRLKKQTSKYELLDIKLEQNFSSITDTKEQSLKRYEIYLENLDEFYKHKRNKFFIFINADLLRLLKLSVKFKSIDFLRIRISK